MEHEDPAVRRFRERIEATPFGFYGSRHPATHTRGLVGGTLGAELGLERGGDSGDRHPDRALPGPEEVVQPTIVEPEVVEPQTVGEITVVEPVEARTEARAAFHNSDFIEAEVVPPPTLGDEIVNLGRRAVRRAVLDVHEAVEGWGD